jgi:hypothetical protein
MSGGETNERRGKDTRVSAWTREEGGVRGKKAIEVLWRMLGLEEIEQWRRLMSA